MRAAKLLLALALLAMLGFAHAQEITAFSAKSISENQQTELTVVFSEDPTVPLTVNFTFSNPEDADWTPITDSVSCPPPSHRCIYTSASTFAILSGDAANYKVVATIAGVPSCASNPNCTKTAYFTVVKQQRSIIPEMHPLLALAAGLVALAVLARRRN